MSREIAAIDWLLETIVHFRAHPEIYLEHPEPREFINFLNGLHTGLQAFGLPWRGEHRQAAVERRGLEFGAAKWETDELKKRGLSPAKIIDELLAIEFEMWQAHRDNLAKQSP